MICYKDIPRDIQTTSLNMSFGLTSCHQPPNWPEGGLGLPSGAPWKEMCRPLSFTERQNSTEKCIHTDLI